MYIYIYIYVARCLHNCAGCCVSVDVCFNLICYGLRRIPKKKNTYKKKRINRHNKRNHVFISTSK